MSKKKAFSGNTMTLKDFHGGSIPSDLPLPSAPGVVVRSSEWSSYDRSNSWGGPMGRPDHRLRPNSSPATRHFDDKTPFLTHTSHIGRHFDEDERKPLDGVSALHRTVRDDSFRVPSSRVELKPEPVSTGRLSGSVSGTQVASSYSGRVSDEAHLGASLQNVGGSAAQSVGGLHPNVWAARKELAVGVNEPVQSAWSGVNAVSKLAHASAVEKVSSGRWQTKHSIHYHTDVEDVEVVQHSDTEKGIGSRGLAGYTYNRMDTVGERENTDAKLTRHVERSLANDNGIENGRKEYVEHERVRATSYSESKGRNPSIHGGRVQQPGTDVRCSGSELLAPVQSELSERPKVKLLPRTKPLENLEPPVVDHKQGYQHPSNSVNGHVETRVLHGNGTAAKSGLTGLESENQAIERPKLNLKPRSQHLEQPEGNREKGRTTVFGGARPREVVLKERGFDDTAISNQDLGQHPDRVRQNVSKTQIVPENPVPNRHGERTDNFPLDQRTGKIFDRKDQRMDNVRDDKQRRNWRNENWRNSRETEKQQQPQLQQERPPSPESWRKPVERSKPVSPDAAGTRYGKTTSAMELAQAFSRSFSDPKTVDQYSGPRGLPGKSQVPFSRLTGPSPRPQINGY